MMIIIIILVIIAIIIIFQVHIEPFDQRSTGAFSQYNPLAMFITAARATTTQKSSIVRTNILNIFNDFVDGKTNKLDSVDTSKVKNLIKSFTRQIEQHIPSYSLIFLEPTSIDQCYTYKYAPNVYFIKFVCNIINRNLQTSNYLEQGDITKLPVNVFVAINTSGEVLYVSVNGFHIEQDIYRYNDPSSKNYYYSAQMLNSNIDDPSQFGGYTLLTPDKNNLRKYCEQRRNELNNYSYCKLNKVNEDGTQTITYDQTVDEINCVGKGGEIIRINTPKFGLLFDNLDAITENVNGAIEINDMYLGESDICADLSEESSEFNQLFDQERKYNKIISM